jgi:hypothetical protein
MHLFWMREGKVVAHKAIRADLAAVMQACGAQSAVELLVEAITI